MNNRVIKLQTPQNLRTLVKNTLNEWHSDYLVLNQLLERELATLENRDFDQLESITSEKNNIMLKINSHDLPGEFKTDAGANAALSKLNDYCEKDKELSEKWETIIALLTDCAHRNEVNGRMIKLLDSSSRRVFNLLKGMDPDNNIYNATGACSRVEASRASVSA